MKIIQSTLFCLGRYILFLIPMIVMLLAVHHFLSLPKEMFRKLLHLPAFLSAPVVTYYAQSWQSAVLTLVVFALVVYPVLVLLEHWKGYSELFVERSVHEIRRSLLLLFLSDAVFVCIGWGILQNRYLAAASILMWGTGDAAAALVGKRFGRHHIKLPLADHKKTWEGSAAMWLTSTITGCLFCTLFLHVSFHSVFLPTVAAALLGAYTECITHHGYDTVTVPAVILLVLALFRI